MILFIKLLFLIHFNHIYGVNDIRPNIKENDECYVDKLWFTQEFVKKVILLAYQILNKISYKKKDVTSYKLWKWWRPYYKYLKVLECLAKVVIPNPKKK